MEVQMPNLPHADMPDETMEYFQDPPGFFDRRRDRGPVIPGKLFGVPCFYFIGPEANEFAHVSGRDHFLNGPAYQRVKDTFGVDAIIAQDGFIWKLQHDLVTPLFSPKYLKHVFAVKTKIYTRRMAEWPAEKQVDLLHECTMLTMRGALKALFGLDVEEIVDDVRQCLIQMGEVAFFTYHDASTHQRAVEARKRLEELLAPQIEEKRKNPGRDGISLYATGYDPPLSNERIIEHAAGLMFAAHDTTKSMMAWSFYLALKNPDYLERVMEEIREIIGPEGDIRFDHVFNPRRLLVMDNLIKEAERMYAPLHPNSRFAKEDFEFGGHEIPAGSIVQVDCFGVHYDPSIYTNPYEFDPDRFAPPREEHKKSAYALFGFGGGERICLGKPVGRMDIKLALTNAFTRYALELEDPENMGIQWGPMTHPLNFLVNVAEKQKSA